MGGRLQIQIKVLDPRAELKQGTPMSAGYDLIAAIDSPISIRNGDKATLIPTGLAIYTGFAEIAGIILPRSGMGHKQGLILGNTLGLIDGDYQNQWFISVWNRGQQDEIIIKPGDRIAQAIFIPVIHPEFVVVDEFNEVTDRGMGGFGSTDAQSALSMEASAAMNEANKVFAELPFKQVESAEHTYERQVKLPPMGSLGEAVEQ